MKLNLNKNSKNFVLKCAWHFKCRRLIKGPISSIKGRWYKCSGPSLMNFAFNCSDNFGHIIFEMAQKCLQFIQIYILYNIPIDLSPCNHFFQNFRVCFFCLFNYLGVVRVAINLELDI